MQIQTKDIRALYIKQLIGFFEKRVLENKKDGSFIINNRRTHSKTISDKLKKYKLPRNIENIKKVYNTNDVESYTTKGKIKYTYNLK